MRAASAILFFLAGIARIRTTFAVADGDDDSDDDFVEEEPEEDWIDEVGMEISPTSGQARPTDNFFVEWEYDGYLTGMATVEVFYYHWDEDKEDYGASTTSVDWSASSVSLPPTFLPHVDEGFTSSISLRAYTFTGIDTDYWSDYFTIGRDIELYASETSTPPVTVTHTLTPTQTDTPASTYPENDSQSGGLSTGGKAGIGVGVSAGAILVAAVAFLLVRRRKRQEPKTIREIPATSTTNLPGAAP